MMTLTPASAAVAIAAGRSSPGSCCSGFERWRNGPEHRKENGKLGALAGLAADLDQPAMVGDDAVDDGKSEPGTFADIFRCEEGLENPIPGLGIHAAPGIRDPEASEIAALREADGDRPHAVTDGLHGIGDQIYDDLLDLAGVGEDKRDIFELLAGQHHRGDGRAQHLKGLAGDRGEVDPCLRHRLMPAKGENASYQVAAV